MTPTRSILALQFSIHKRFNGSSARPTPASPSSDPSQSSSSSSQSQSSSQSPSQSQSSSSSRPSSPEKDHRARALEHTQEIIDVKQPDMSRIRHPNTKGEFEDYLLPRYVWSEEDCKNVKITHVEPEFLSDRLAYLTVWMLRMCWDLTTGYTFGRKWGFMKFTHDQWLLRISFLETVAGVPGMMFAMARHLRSLRTMQRDHGWIHTLLEEAENERMHLLVALKLYQPRKVFRYLVLIAQGIFSNYLFLAYFVSPRYCHRFVGYLEEQAVRTYTELLDDISKGRYPKFTEPCDEIARHYWRLPEGSTWKDVFAQMRCDEANHRYVNHVLAPLSVDPHADNPFRMSHKKHGEPKR